MNKTNQNVVDQDEPTVSADKVADKVHEQDLTDGTAVDAQTGSAPVSDEDIAGEASAIEPDPIQQLEAEVAQLKDTLLRRTAEFENIRKRMLRERMELLEGAKVEALKSFLPVNDDLQRTVQAAAGQDIPEGFLQGVTMVAGKFSDILSAAGVEPILETGVPFDVNIHDALMRQASPDGKTPSDTVLQVLEPGYKFGDKVIRHAKVIVSE